MEITSLKAGRGRDKKVVICLDGKPAFKLLAETALKEGLKVGQELSENQMEALAGLDRAQRCLNAAFRYLAYRPRSEAEVRQRLLQRGFDSATADDALARLKERGLIDDAAFARFWKDNRESFSPRSRRLTGVELRRKGLPADVIDSIVREIDETDCAYRAASVRAGRLPLSDYQLFRGRLAGYLGRRGFGYKIIKETVDRLWAERSRQKVG